MGDLLIEFSPPRQANDTLFRMVAACLEAIAESSSDLQAVVRYFEVWLLKIEGFLPDLKRCPDCTHVLGGEPVYMGNDLALRCRDCSNGRGGTIEEFACSSSCNRKFTSSAICGIDPGCFE